MSDDVAAQGYIMPLTT